MTHPETCVTKVRGFTLIETIIYVALFGIMFTGIFMSVYPLFTNAERLSRNIATQSESVFILAKINYALKDTITSSRGLVTLPAEGSTAEALVLAYDGAETYAFTPDTSNAFCTPPNVCSILTMSSNVHAPLPLHAERVNIENFSVTHHAPTGDSPRMLEVSFTANGTPIGPIHYYLHV